MKQRILYLFDPLCGWCYGATAALEQLQERDDLTVAMMPSGHFSGEGARPMDDNFANFAWDNDQRIARLTGQVFTEDYRQQVLGNRQHSLDSGPATIALTAVALSEPTQEFAALKAIQQARYVAGQDVTSLSTLSAILRQQGLAEAAAKLQQPDAALLQATGLRTERSRELMQEVGARGVPTLLLESNNKRQLLRTDTMYSQPNSVVEQALAH